MCSRISRVKRVFGARSCRGLSSSAMRRSQSAPTLCSNAPMPQQSMLARAPMRGFASCGTLLGMPASKVSSPDTHVVCESRSLRHASRVVYWVHIRPLCLCSGTSWILVHVSGAPCIYCKINFECAQDETLPPSALANHSAGRNLAHLKTQRLRGAPARAFALSHVEPPIAPPEPLEHQSMEQVCSEPRTSEPSQPPFP